MKTVVANLMPLLATKHALHKELEWGSRSWTRTQKAVCTEHLSSMTLEIKCLIDTHTYGPGRLTNYTAF
jgi:hypothetical protein